MNAPSHSSLIFRGEVCDCDFEPERISTDWKTICDICADCPLCCGNILHSKTPQFKLTASLFFPVRLYRSLSFGAPDLTQKYNSGEAAGAGGGTEFRCHAAFWAHQQCWGGMYKPAWGPTSTNWISPVQHPLVTTRIGEAGRAKPWRCTVHKWSEHILRPARESWQESKLPRFEQFQSRQPFPTKGIFLLNPDASEVPVKCAICELPCGNQTWQWKIPALNGGF